MKRIIDGKVYNTETAELVLSWDNRRAVNDFKRREKDLYLTKKGNWFIYHYGGPMTDMAVGVGNNAYGGSENIEPITPENAFRFLCSHGGAVEAEKYFADKIEEA